jgi:transcription termination factor Rho
MDEIQQTTPVKKSRRVVADGAAPAEKTEAPKRAARAKVVKADAAEPKVEKAAPEKSETRSSDSSDSGESTERSGGNNNRNRNRNRSGNGRSSGNSGNGGEGREQREGGDDNRDNSNRDNSTRDNDSRNERDFNDERRGNNRNRNRNRDRYRDRDNRGRRGGNSQQDEIEPEISPDDVLVPVAGILDVLENYAFVRTSGYLPGPNDVYVSLGQVKKYNLRKGDAVVGSIRQPREGDGQGRSKFNAIVRIESINGLTVEQAATRVEFGKLTPLYPQTRLRL